MKPAEITAITVLVIAVVIFSVWGAREIVKNSTKQFILTENQNNNQKTEFTLDDVISEITQ